MTSQIRDKGFKVRTARSGKGGKREPFEVRKATLASLLRSCPLGVRLNEHLTHDGNVVFRHACKMGLEGIVSKRLGSIYRSGRCKDWLKFENPPRRQCGGRRRKTGEVSRRGERTLGFLMALLSLATKSVREADQSGPAACRSYFRQGAMSNDPHRPQFVQRQRPGLRSQLPKRHFSMPPPLNSSTSSCSIVSRFDQLGLTQDFLFRSRPRWQDRLVIPPRRSLTS
jgi:hypothetical protein